jgi:cyclopropane-fatty-acyl-phospholipid synthase
MSNPVSLEQPPLSDGAAGPAASPAASPAVAFLSRIFPEPRNFALHLWDGTVLPAEGEPRFSIAIRSPAVLRAMFRPPMEKSLANAYLSGGLDVEGDLSAVYPIVDACRKRLSSAADFLALARLWRALPRGDAGITNATAPIRLAGRRHSQERDSDAIRYHYDLGNDFYALFLDSRMVYTCAYYPTGREDLETAQLLKLDLVCRKLRLQPGERLLDLGCGWGGLLIHAAERYGVYGVGITLSRSQQEFAQQRVAAAGLSDRIEVRLADYRTLEGETFDKAASIGMLEHIGRSQLAEYFTTVYEVMKPGGLLLNHGMSRHAVQPRTGLRGVLLDPINRLIVGRSPVGEAVFPDAELIPVSEVNLAAERARWEVRDVEALREHYATTARHWVLNMQAKEEEAIRLVGRSTYRLWLMFLAGNAHRLDSGQVGVNQTLLAKLDTGGRAAVPPSRQDLYT